MRLRFLQLLIISTLIAPLPACEKKTSPTPSPPSVELQTPPAPPILETFDGQPQLSLFPRIGDFRPEDTDQKNLPFWNTYIEHLTRLSGVVALPAPLGHGRVFALRTTGGLDSVAFFSPLEVLPGTFYEVTAFFRSDLPRGASTGIGILEFDEFLWVDQQYPKSLVEKHLTGAREGVRLQGKNDWRKVGFRFTTGGKTRMVHLIFFREGTEGREPVLIDDIRVEKAGP